MGTVPGKREIGVQEDFTVLQNQNFAIDKKEQVSKEKKKHGGMTENWVLGSDA